MNSLQLPHPVLRITVAFALCSAAHAFALNGTVRDTSGNPVSGALVRLVLADRGTTTDANGYFSFESSAAVNARTTANRISAHVSGGTITIDGVQYATVLTVRFFGLDGRLLYKFEPHGINNTAVVSISAGTVTRCGILVVNAGTQVLRLLYNPMAHLLVPAGGFTPASAAPADASCASAANIDSLIVTHVRYTTTGLTIAPQTITISVALTPKSAPYLKLPDTGQLTGYTETPGEDADVTTNNPAYIDNGNSTVTDAVTGLIWQQKESAEMDFGSAKSYCSALVSGGHGNWRLPSSHELFSITNCDRFNPALDPAYFFSAGAEYRWTSAIGADKSGTVWVANAGGGIGAHPQTESKSAGGAKIICVRCVYGDSVPADLLHAFVDNGDSTVTDNTFGLTWQQQEAGMMTWEQALYYADTLSLGGHGDWRIPDIKELRSMNDDRIANPSIDKAFFPRAIAAPYWSSTTQLHSPATAWMTDFRSGLVSYKEKTSTCNVRCVRRSS